MSKSLGGAAATGRGRCHLQGRRRSCAREAGTGPSERLDLCHAAKSYARTAERRSAQPSAAIIASRIPRKPCKCLSGQQFSGLFRLCYHPGCRRCAVVSAPVCSSRRSGTPRIPSGRRDGSITVVSTKPPNNRRGSRSPIQEPRTVPASCSAGHSWSVTDRPMRRPISRLHGMRCAPSIRERWTRGSASS